MSSTPPRPDNALCSSAIGRCLGQSWPLCRCLGRSWPAIICIDWLTRSQILWAVTGPAAVRQGLNRRNLQMLYRYRRGTRSTAAYTMCSKICWCPFTVHCRGCFSYHLARITTYMPWQSPNKSKIRNTWKITTKYVVVLL